MSRGLVFVLSAPSGAGKSTLLKRLMAEFPNFGFSVSHTTRPPRGRERDGADYRFTDRATFQERAAQGYFAEWAEVHGNLYGTPKGPVEDMVAGGRDVLFDIDVQGALQLREHFPDGSYVFLVPPSRAELERRLRGRGTDSEEAVAKRLANAKNEILQARHFDHLVVNDDLDTAYDHLRACYLAGKTGKNLALPLVDSLLAGWD